MVAAFELGEFLQLRLESFNASSILLFHRIESAPIFVPPPLSIIQLLPRLLEVMGEHSNFGLLFSDFEVQRLKVAPRVIAFLPDELFQHFYFLFEFSLFHFELSQLKVYLHIFGLQIVAFCLFFR